MNRAAISILLSLFAGSLSVEGQFLKGWGVMGGIALANQSVQFTSIDYAIETQPVAGPCGAIFLEAFKRNHLSFRFDLAVGSKGSKTNTHSVSINHFDNDRITENRGSLTESKSKYVVFSPMARYSFEIGNLTPYFLLGPRIDYLLHYQTSAQSPLESQNKLILGLTGGTGIEYGVGKFAPFLELQFQPDLSPVTNQDPLLVNNNALLLNLGIRVSMDSL